jgi:hypothetical protein
VTSAGINVVRAADVMLEHALVAGDALLAAKQAVKQALGPGHWLSWLQKECDLSEREAQRYMFIARHRATLEANTTCVSDLSLAGAIRLIKSLQAPKTDGRPPRRSPRPQSEKSTPFDALGWWSGAKLEERRHFVDGIGAHGVAEAIPPNWGVRLADSGESMGEIARLRARVAALEAVVRERDRAIQKLQRQLMQIVWHPRCA